MNKIWVFMIEGDATTTLADLQGTGPNTTGDWVTGTNYPIIDSDSIAIAYEITYYPTLFHICPDKIVTEIGQVTADVHYSENNSCAPWIQGNNNVGAASYSGTSNVECGSTGTVSPQLTIRNMGELNLTSCTVDFMQDSSAIQSIDWTGDLATLETADIAFDDVDVINYADFSFAISMPNGVSDEAENDNVLNKQIGVSAQTASTVFFEITTDFWPSEISWQLKDGNGATLYSNEDEGTLGCDETYNQTYELIVGDCYTFSIQDGYGDGQLNGTMSPGHGCGTANGIANMAMGAVKLYSATGTIWDDIAYGNGYDLEFIVSTATATAEVELNGLNIYPNPATDNVTVAFDLAETSELEVAVLNILGKQVITTGAVKYSAGSNNININTSALSSGIYFISLREGDKITSRKVSILK